MIGKGPITSHVLDTSIGRPAAGMQIDLCRRSSGDHGWEIVATATTDVDGRAGELIARDALTIGVYRLRFATGDYFQGRGVATFYPNVEVDFRVETLDESFHVPLLISPFGYSTYRGS